MNKSTYRKKRDIIFREEGDEAILFSPDTSGIIVINSTGCFIWQLLNGKRTKEDILKEMTKEFDVELSLAQKDLGDFINELEKQDFIERL